MNPFRPLSRIVLGALCLAFLAPGALAQKDQPTPKNPGAKPVPPAGKTPAAPDAAALAKINKKLNTITFPRVEFREATVREACEFLAQKSKQLDPENEGVKIVVKLPPPPAAPLPDAGKPAGIPGLPDEPAPAVAPAFVSGGETTRLTLNLSNVPLIEVLKYVTNLANLEYQISPTEVTILPLKPVPAPPEKKR